MVGCTHAHWMLLYCAGQSRLWRIKRCLNSVPVYTSWKNSGIKDGGRGSPSPETTSCTLRYCLILNLSTPWAQRPQTQAKFSTHTQAHTHTTYTEGQAEKERLRRKNAGILFHNHQLASIPQNNIVTTTTKEIYAKQGILAAVALH